MKRYLLLIVLAVTFTCEGLQAQAKPLTKWVSGTKTAPAGWFDTTTVSTVSLQFINGFVYNTGSDSIYVAMDDDTTMARYVVIRPGYTQTFWSIFKRLRVKARTAGTAYQYHFE